MESSKLEFKTSKCLARSLFPGKTLVRNDKIILPRYANMNIYKHSYRDMNKQRNSIFFPRIKLINYFTNNKCNNKFTAKRVILEKFCSRNDVNMAESQFFM